MNEIASLCLGLMLKPLLCVLCFFMNERTLWLGVLLLGLEFRFSEDCEVARTRMQLQGREHRVIHFRKNTVIIIFGISRINIKSQS